MRWLIFIAFYILLDIYAFQAYRTLVKAGWPDYLYILFSAALVIGFVYLMNNPLDGTFYRGLSSYVLGLMLAVILAKLIIIIFLFGEDIARSVAGLFKKLTPSNTSFEMASRRKFLSTLALGVAAIPFGALLYGMIWGKYNYQVLKYELSFDDLPDAFDGYQITQISDLHCGSFDNYDKVKYGIDLANAQKSDVLFFTGDLVNARASETKKWRDLFNTLDAPDGVFSIMGNHDYGDHGGNWKNKAEQEQSVKDLQDTERGMDWRLLLNEHQWIEREGQRIAVVGVENWGAGGFVKYGDLDKAGDGLTKRDFKVLLSHDPSHWHEKVRQDDKNYQLTLSGHTHGMQFGIEIPGWIKWSPVKYRYKNWAGIYKEFGRFINVNRGFGYLGYPGRVGIWPEISVITLRKSKKSEV